MGPSKNTSDKSASNKLQKLFIIIIAVVILVAGIAALYWNFATKTIQVGDKTYRVKMSEKEGTLEVEFSNLSDYSGLAASVNNQTMTPTTTGVTYEQLPPGDFSLSVTKPGYTKLTIQFSIVSTETTLVNANLQPSENTAITSWGQLNVTGDPILYDTPSQFLHNKPITISLVSVQYFYNKTWAIVTFNDGSENGYEVVQFNFSSNKWQGIAGTSQFFSPNDVNKMPTKVQSYLVGNNHTYSE